jgi:hypothetical protein
MPDPRPSICERCGALVVDRPGIIVRVGDLMVLALCADCSDHLIDWLALPSAERAAELVAIESANT